MAQTGAEWGVPAPSSTHPTTTHGPLTYLFPCFPPPPRARLLLLVRATPHRQQGLIARSYVTPNETHGGGGLWTPSTAQGYENWTWKADASRYAFPPRIHVCVG